MGSYFGLYVRPRSMRYVQLLQQLGHLVLARGKFKR